MRSFSSTRSPSCISSDPCFHPASAAGDAIQERVGLYPGELHLASTDIGDLAQDLDANPPPSMTISSARAAFSESLDARYVGVSVYHLGWLEEYVGVEEPIAHWLSLGQT